VAEAGREGDLGGIGRDTVNLPDSGGMSARHHRMADVQELERLIAAYPGDALKIIARYLLNAEIWARGEPPPS